MKRSNQLLAQSAAVGAILLMPWMVRRLVFFTVEMLADFRPLLR